jgi:hypothetical protein
MATKLALILVAVLAPAGIAWAGDDAAPAQSTGKVLVLDNERTLEGNIEQRGDQYRVRRTVGELWVQKENVLRLCDSYKDAYAFLRSRANQRDPDEHLRLAHWCQLHGLRAEAVAEVSEAVDLRPEHAESRRLLRNLQRAAVVGPQTAQTARATQAAENTQAATNVNSDSVSAFVARVQPILMNACANCHANGRGGDFKLARTYDGGAVGRKTTLQNLTAVLAQVNKENYQASPFLAKSISAHGSSALAPLKGRDSLAYRTLEDWVRTTVESNPQLQEKTIASAGPFSATEGAVKNPPPFAREAKPGPAVPSPQLAETKPASFSTERSNVGELKKSSEPVDPFDPVLFNRQAHPEPSAPERKSP